MESDRPKALDPQDLARLLVAFEQAGDAEGMAGLYELEAVLDIGLGRTSRGRQAIRFFYQDVIAMGVKFELAAQRPALVLDCLALTSTRLPDGTVTAEVARWQPYGSWLWAIDQPSVAPGSA